MGKIMILQGVGDPISCLGVCYANDPKKGGYTPLAPALDLATSLRGDFRRARIAKDGGPCVSMARVPNSIPVRCVGCQLGGLAPSCGVHLSAPRWRHNGTPHGGGGPSGEGPADFQKLKHRRGLGERTEGDTSLARSNRHNSGICGRNLSVPSLRSTERSNGGAQGPPASYHTRVPARPFGLGRSSAFFVPLRAHHCLCLENPNPVTR